MLDKIIVVLTAWLPLSLIVALLVGWASKFRAPLPKGLALQRKTQAADVEDLNKRELPVYLSHSPRLTSGS
jgi:hypothetical protein